MGQGLGTYIRSRRQALALRQWDLAKACGTDQARISLWENGYVTPTPEQMGMIANALHVELTDMPAADS